MLLAVDVGNSQTVIGVFDNSKLISHWRISSDPQRTPDELALLFQGFMAFEDLTFTRNVHGLVIASVVPGLTEMFRVMAHKYFAFPPIVVEPGVKTGMPIRVDSPREVGADRLVNALAGYVGYGGPGIVVDFGTATSFDVWSAKGEFIGGAIAPGVATSMRALSARGAQLRGVELRAPANAIGTSTVEAMQSGAVHGFAGQVDRIVEELSAELGPEPVVIATGGLAPAVRDACRSIQHHSPWLTLEGLRLVWERNVS